MNTLLNFLDIDIALVSIFLAVTLVVGIYHGRQVKDLKDYALGGKNFSTSILVATIIATCASGSGLYTIIENTYIQGFYFLLALMGFPLSIWLIGQFLALRMGPFMNNLSVAEAMGDLYGKGIRVITGITAIVSQIGLIAIQFKVIGNIFSSLLHLDSSMLTIVAAIIVLVYTSFGGVRSVTFTDVLQFFTFGILIPILALSIWNHMQGPEQQVAATLTTNPLFDLKTVVGWNPRFMATLGLLTYFAMPNIYSPDLFQRVAMARDPQQAKRAFTYAAGIFLLLLLLQAWIGILLLADHPGIASKKEIIPHLITHHTYVGLRGLLGAGVVALAMSTADSVLNACSVLFANDLVKPLAGKDQGTVTTARVFSFFMGLAALVLALYSTDFLKLLLVSNSFYMPIVTVPMLMAILGFRSTTRAVLIGMVAGGGTVLVWSIMGHNKDSIVPGMLANLLGLIGSHYLLMEPGGWMPLELTSPLFLARLARQNAWEQWIKFLLRFNLYVYLRHNLPKQKSFYILFACYIMVTHYMAFYTIGASTIPAYRSIYYGLSFVVLVTVLSFFTFPISSLQFKKYSFLTFIWPLGIATILFVAGPMLAILSHFSLAQMVVMMLNFLIGAFLLRWSLAVILALGGISLAVLFFQRYTGEVLSWSSLSLLPPPYGPLLFVIFLIALYQARKAYAKLNREKNILAHVDQKHQGELLAEVAKNRQYIQAFKNIHGEFLFTLIKELHKLPKADTAHLQAIQPKLISLALQLQGLTAKAQDYLQLHIVRLPIRHWIQRVEHKLQARGLSTSIYFKPETKRKKVEVDAESMTQLLVNSIVFLRTSDNTQPEEEQPPLIIDLNDTLLTYPLPDVAPGYLKQVPALRVVVTTAGEIPPLASSYVADLSASQTTTSRTLQALDQLINDQVIKAHYGYAEVSPNTLCYVFPVNVNEVRPKDLDQSLGAKAVRANDHYKSDTIDAQAQEQEFLAAVAQRSKAEIDLVKIALELIKWCHGPASRHSGEPFYLHPLSVAQIVLDYNTDEATVLGALLHETVADTAMLLNHIETVFGPETAEVVNVVTHLYSIPGSLYKMKLSAEEQIRMLEQTGNERALYVKLADRMHDLRTMEGHASLDQRQEEAEVTLQFFVPLADRLGLEQAKEELQARCGAVLEQ